MSEIHTKKHLAEHPELMQESSSHNNTETAPILPQKKSFFSGILFRVIVVLVLLTGVGIYTFIQSQKVLLDNPSTETITVKIDDKEYTIEPNKSLTVNVSTGKHKLSVVGSPDLDTEFERPSMMNVDNILQLSDAFVGVYPIVNPLQYPYIIDFQIYSSRASVDSNSIPESQIIDTVYIPIQWNYGLDEQFPESVRESRRSKKDTIKKKIFRLFDYAKELNISQEELLNALNGSDA